MLETHPIPSTSRSYLPAWKPPPLRAYPKPLREKVEKIFEEVGTL